MKASTITKETILYRDLPTRSYPEFFAGDRIVVSQKIKEGDKERIQAFEGDVIAIHNNGISSTFVVRKLSANGVYVERIFPYYAPTIAEITVVRRGKVRRAKLYYMRDRVGKSARIEELIVTKEQKKDAAV